MGKTGGTDFKSASLPFFFSFLVKLNRFPFLSSALARGLPRGLPLSRPFFPRFLVDDQEGWMDGKKVLIAPLETPGRAPADVGR